MASNEDMERQDFINTITELKAMISSLKLTIDTLRQTINSQNATIASLQKSMDRLQSAYDKAVKERDACKSADLQMGRKTTKSFSLVLLHDKFKQTKVKTKIINGSPAPVYKGVEAIECLQIILQMLDSASFFNATHFLKYYHEKMETKKGLSGNLVGISINLCKSIQKELFINDTPQRCSEGFDFCIKGFSCRIR